MLRDRHMRTLILGALLGGSFFLLEELTYGAAFDLVTLRDWILAGGFGAAVLLAPDRPRAKRGAILMTLAAALVVVGGLAVAKTALIVACAIVLGRLGERRRLFDAGLAAVGLLLAAGIVAQTTITEALALWSFFLIQSLHPVLVEGDLIAANEPPPRSPREDAFSEARDEILSVLEA